MQYCLSEISELCEVEYFWIDWTGTLTFFGSSAGTQLAHYLVVVVSRAIDAEYRAYRDAFKQADRRLSRNASASFKTAMAIKIGSRLSKMAEEKRDTVRAKSAGTDLVEVQGTLREKRFLETYGKIKGTRLNYRSKLRDESSAIKGFDAGSRVPLNLPVGKLPAPLAPSKMAGPRIAKPLIEICGRDYFPDCYNEVIALHCIGTPSNRGELMISSQDIAAIAGKTHDHVRRDIRKLRKKIRQTIEQYGSRQIW